MPPLLQLDASIVRDHLPMAKAVTAVTEALKALSAKIAFQPLRQVHKLPTANLGFLACMPSFHDFSEAEGSGPMCCTKVLCNRVFQNDRGGRLAILGTGTQSVMHVVAMQAVRKLESVTVCAAPLPKHSSTFQNLWDRRTKEFADTVTVFGCFCLRKGCPAYSKRMAIGDVTPFEAAKDAVQDAGIICTLTSATEPILRKEWVKAGCHINAVGACTPAHRELDTDLVTTTELFVDTKEACIKEPGDIVIPQQAGDRVDILGEVGDVLLGSIPGRRSARSITVFKSVGAAVEDLFVVEALYRSVLATQRTEG